MQSKANNREFANLKDADFANVATHAKFAKINAKAYICAKSSSTHKHKCKYRWIKSDYQKTLIKIIRNIILQKKINCQSQKWELNFKDDKNAKFNE